MKNKKHLVGAASFFFAATTLSFALENQNPELLERQSRLVFDQGRNSGQAVSAVNSQANLRLPSDADIIEAGLDPHNVSDADLVSRGFDPNRTVGTLPPGFNPCKPFADSLRTHLGVPNAAWTGVGGAMALGSGIALGVTAGSIPVWGSLLLAGGLVAGLVLGIVFAVRTAKVYSDAAFIEKAC